jgi:hypothetical protein
LASSDLILFNSAAFQGFSPVITTKGAGAPLIGFKAAPLLDLITGFAGGSITNLRPAITGCALAFGIVEVTEIVVEEPDVEVCNFAGKGFPGVFFNLDFLLNEGLIIFGERLAIFFEAFLGAVFFDLTFFANFFTDPFAADFSPFFIDLFGTFLIATLPPEEVRLWLDPNNYQLPPPKGKMRGGIGLFSR